MTRRRKTLPRRHEPAHPKRDSTDDSGDATIDEAMERFVRVLVRRGASRRSVERAFRRAWLRVPRGAALQGERISRELADVPHVLTLWFGDPLYVDARGNPLQLPLRGPAPSLASLIQHVDPTLDPKEVLKTLLRADAVRPVGTRYAPRSRAVAYRGTGAPLHAHNLRGLLGMLRVLEHNIQPKGKVAPWFEYLAENPRFPVSAREPFDARLHQAALTFLHNQDSKMLSSERRAKPGERTVRMGVGIYRFEEEMPPSVGAPPRVKRRPASRTRHASPRRRR